MLIFPAPGYLFQGAFAFEDHERLLYHSNVYSVKRRVATIHRTFVFTNRSKTIPQKQTHLVTSSIFINKSARHFKTSFRYDQTTLRSSAIQPEINKVHQHNSNYDAFKMPRHLVLTHISSNTNSNKRVKKTLIIRPTPLHAITSHPPPP